MNGILLVDKPSGMTSHDVVDAARGITGMRRIGHTGTLDPAATGLLVLCLGWATRLSEHLTGLDKTYEGAMRLGIATDSYDLDGKIVEERPVPSLDVPEIQAACDRFVGAIQQVPPMVSAVKVGGKRLYKSARQGEIVERAPRPVTVYEFAVTGYAPPDAFIRVRCSRGTYVRSLCHDAGNLLGCGATLAALRRTFVGTYSVENALQLGEGVTRDDVRRRLLPMDEALTLPVVVLRPGRRNLVASGGMLGPADLAGENLVSDGWVQIKTESGRLVALGQVESGPEGPRVHARRVFLE